MNQNQKLSWPVRLACVLLGVDPDILIQVPRREQRRVVSEALLLGLVAGMSGALWFMFLAQFYGITVASLGGAFAAIFIFLIDAFMGAASWALTGVLRPPGTRRGHDAFIGIALRAAMTGVFSTATSTGATMAMFHDTIMTQIDEDRHAINDATNAKFRTRADALRTQYLGTDLQTIEKLQQQVTEFGNILAKAREDRAAASTQLENFKIEADRELKGAQGYKAGAGPKYRENLARLQAAQAALAQAEADIETYEARFADAQHKLDEATAGVKTGQGQFQQAFEKLEKERLGQLVPERADGLMAYIALTEVFVSPRFGKAAQHFAWLIMAVLMAVELAYLIVRLWFNPASLYHLMLTSDTKLRAERAAANYERDVKSFRDPEPTPSAPPPLRFARRDPPADAPPEAAD